MIKKVPTYESEMKIGRKLFQLSKQFSDPKLKIKLEKFAAIHYARAYKLKKKVNG